MAEIEYIKHLWEEEGKSLREITRITGLSFQTVQKYAYMEKWSEEKPPSVSPGNYPVLGEYIPIIDEWLEADAREPRKQRHTMQRISDRLRDEHGYTGSYSSVKRYVRKKKYLMGRTSEGFLPLEQPKGHAQIDFGAFKYYDGLGQDCNGHALTITFPYSNMGFTQVFKGENQECLLEGMKRIFEHVDGVPLRIKADNMPTAVARILAGHDRKLAEGFARFRLYYCFEADFCNPASGNEKGNVENKVGFDRRNFLVPVPNIDDFALFNAGLFRKCDQDGNREHYRRKVPMKGLWEDERRVLKVLPPHSYEVFRMTAARINKYGFVSVDCNQYSVSPELAGKMASVKIYFDHVEVYHEHALFACYERSYGKSEDVFDWKQYIKTLCKKPGAVEHTRFFNQLPKLWQSHLAASQGTERKSALSLLLDIVNDGNERLCDGVLEKAFLHGRTDSESLRHFYYSLASGETSSEPLQIANAVVLGYEPDLTAYDFLSGGAVNA
jgi:transposase